MSEIIAILQSSESYLPALSLRQPETGLTEDLGRSLAYLMLGYMMTLEVFFAMNIYPANSHQRSSRLAEL